MLVSGKIRVCDDVLWCNCLGLIGYEMNVKMLMTWHDKRDHGQGRSFRHKVTTFLQSLFLLVTKCIDCYFHNNLTGLKKKKLLTPNDVIRRLTTNYSKTYSYHFCGKRTSKNYLDLGVGIDDLYLNSIWTDSFQHHICNTSFELCEL